MEQFPLNSMKEYTLPYVNSISTGLSSQWTYSPSFYGVKLLASASVSLTGTRKKDYDAAEKESGQKHTPGVTVWHHVYDFDRSTGKATMQLVAWNHHQETIPHAGGFKQYNAGYSQSNRQLLSDEDIPIIQLNAPAYSSKALDEFSCRTGLSLPQEIRRFYNQDIQLNQEALRRAALNDFHLDAILPLQDQEGASVEGMHQLLKNHPAPSLLQDHTVTGLDACGNLFCADKTGAVLFYDHETGELQTVGLSLNDLIK